VACKDKKRFKQNKIVREWIGKTIQFPNIDPTYIITKGTFDSIESKEFKILLYTDSTGCTRCKSRMYIWQNYIEELGNQVNFLFYFYPKNEESLLSMLKLEIFNYPVFIDNNDKLNKLNKFSNNSMFQCFLLDKNNKILAMGNPVNNPQIWKLYKQIITGEVSTKQPVTTVETEQSETELKDLQIGKTSEAAFILKNTGTQPLIIQMVNTSCGCTVPEWEKQPIAAGKNTEIAVKITPEEKGSFNKTVTVHCNTEEGQILLKVSGMVE
jgi:hypothetical protein